MPAGVGGVREKKFKISLQRGLRTGEWAIWVQLQRGGGFSVPIICLSHSKFSSLPNHFFIYAKFVNSPKVIMQGNYFRGVRIFCTAMYCLSR